MSLDSAPLLNNDLRSVFRDQERG